MANELIIVDDRADTRESLVRSHRDQGFGAAGLPLLERDSRMFGPRHPADLILADLDETAASGIAFTATASDPRVTEKANGPSAQ